MQHGHILKSQMQRPSHAIHCMPCCSLFTSRLFNGQPSQCHLASSNWSFYTTDCTCPSLLHGQISYLQRPISHSRRACNAWAFPMLKYRYDIHRSGRPRYPVTLRARMQCLKHDVLLRCSCFCSLAAGRIPLWNGLRVHVHSVWHVPAQVKELYWLPLSDRDGMTTAFADTLHIGTALEQWPVLSR